MNYTTIAANCAAQRQASLFDGDEAPSFELTEYDTAEDLGRADTERAAAYGATFAESGDDWIARAPSGVSFKEATREGAAAALCNYFGL